MHGPRPMGRAVVGTKIEKGDKNADELSPSDTARTTKHRKPSISSSSRS